VLGAILVLASVDMIGLAVDVEIMNALLLPIVLGFLLLLESKALPPKWRMRGARKYITWTLCTLVIAFGLYFIPYALGFFH
jgi:Mn2+/Fe2+ NRAMP family transporter